MQQRLIHSRLAKLGFIFLSNINCRSGHLKASDNIGTNCKGPKLILASQSSIWVCDNSLSSNHKMGYTTGRTKSFMCISPARTVSYDSSKLSSQRRKKNGLHNVLTFILRIDIVNKEENCCKIWNKGYWFSFSLITLPWCVCVETGFSIKFNQS